MICPNAYEPSSRRFSSKNANEHRNHRHIAVATLSLPTKPVNLLIDHAVDENQQRANVLLERLNSLLDVSEA